MRQRGLFAVLAAGSLAAALLGCTRGKEDVKEPTPGPDTDDPPVQGAAPCDQEIALECPDGMSDGCSRQSEDGTPLTGYHVCVPAEEQASQPCEQELARECGEGLTDACLLDPPAASSHLCVQATAGVAPEPTEPAQPEPATEPAPEPEPAPETPETQG